MINKHPGRPESGYENAKLERAYQAELAAASNIPAPEDSEIETIETVMRAKMRIEHIEKWSDECEQLKLQAVCKTDAYPADGLDEDNSFARWTPSAWLDITITNPALIGKFAVGQKFYCDFSLAEK